MTSERVDSLASLAAIGEGLLSERASHRLPLGSLSRSLPSKWEDAHKWIASPASNVSKIELVGQGVDSQMRGYFELGNQQSIKVVVEVPGQRVVTNEEPHTKGIDWSYATEGHGVYPTETFSKPMLMIEDRVKESISLNRHNSSASIHGSTTFTPPPTGRSVSMRDMGTEMTPIASQEPSRTGTPARATTPARSPIPSQPSSPGRATNAISPVDPQTDSLSSNSKDLSAKEQQMKTRREIMNLGTQLGKMNIAAWAGRENDDKGASCSWNALQREEPGISVVEARAAAWEEAEKAKYIARFSREEINIHAWEDHQKAKTEAEMRKIEVEAERLRAKAHDKLMNKLAAVRHKAEEKLAAAEAKRKCHATKAEQKAEYIRKTGRIPSSFSCCYWCF